MEPARTLAKCLGLMSLGIGGAILAGSVVLKDDGREVRSRHRQTVELLTISRPYALVHVGFGVLRQVLPQTGGGVVLYLRFVLASSALLTVGGVWARRRSDANESPTRTAVRATANAVHLAWTLLALIGLRTSRRGWVWFQTPD